MSAGAPEGPAATDHINTEHLYSHHISAEKIIFNPATEPTVVVMHVVHWGPVLTTFIIVAAAVWFFSTWGS